MFFSQNLCDNPLSIIIFIPGPLFLLLWERNRILYTHGYALFPTQITCYDLVIWVKCWLCANTCLLCWTPGMCELKNNIPLEGTVQPHPTSSQSSLLHTNVHRKRGKKRTQEASLVAQWLRIHLPMQETRVQYPGWEGPPCCGTIKQATTTEPVLEPGSCNYWAHAH